MADQIINPRNSDSDEFDIPGPQQITIKLPGALKSKYKVKKKDFIPEPETFSEDGDTYTITWFNNYELELIGKAGKKKLKYDLKLKKKGEHLFLRDENGNITRLAFSPANAGNGDDISVSLDIADPSSGWGTKTG